MVFESLPGRPLRRREVDTLGDADAIDGIFPLYGERPANRDTVHGIIIKTDTTAYALAYLDTEGWTVVDTADVAPGEGIRVHEQELLDELWNSITDRLHVEELPRRR